MKIYKATAPSNIALVKYMGKLDSTINRPTNSSLSLTTNLLVTEITARLEGEAEEDIWLPLEKEKFYNIRLSETGKLKFLNAWKNLKNEFGITGNFLISSANNFPSDCGIASSASSFAALTLLAQSVAMDQKGSQMKLPMESLALLSQKGSGSSSRSLFSPWCAWTQERFESFESPFDPIHHFVVVVSSRVKTVSSSEAHKRVPSSALFVNRANRAEERFVNIQKALMSGADEDWKRLFEWVWAEFWDMHALFETSLPTFGYMEDGSLKVLNLVRDYWRANKTGPLVTMDAGANVHLLWRSQDVEKIPELMVLLEKDYKILQGHGSSNGKF